MIKIGFSTTNSLVSRIIRKVTRSRISHAFLLIEGSFLGYDMVMQATSKGFEMVTYDVFKTGNTIVNVITPVVPIDNGVKEATKWLGEHYDFTGLAGMLFVLLGRWLKRKWKNPLHDANGMFCSEVIVRALQANPYPNADSLDPPSVDPEDLEEFLERVSLASHTS